ncbi:hypothetical protein J7L27_07305 [Candidatus Bathyarchaeota archaeon]|nr:hypothetical protein [Candidatus Bathyarchaeota archaeon]
MYYYVKKTGSLPPLCRNCWKVLVFFDEAMLFHVLEEKLKKERILDFHGLFVSGKNYTFKVIPTEKGGRLMVIYTHSKDDRDRVRLKLSEICNRDGIDCRIRFRRAGRYWQDMFPELFRKSLRGYIPFYSEFFEFRRKVETLSEEELKERVIEELTRLEKLIPEGD